MAAGEVRSCPGPPQRCRHVHYDPVPVPTCIDVNPGGQNGPGVQGNQLPGLPQSGQGSQGGQGQLPGQLPVLPQAPGTQDGQRGQQGQQLAAVSYLARYSGHTHALNALRASEAAAVRVEDYAETLRGHRVLHLVGKGNEPATMPITVPALRVLEAFRGDRTTGRLILRPLTGNPIDRRDAYRMVARIAKAAGIPRHISPQSLRHAAITNALDAGVPLRDAQILARHADPRTTERYDRARCNLDRHGVHFLTAYVAGV